MEERRQLRQAKGRLMARGVCSAISEVAMFLGFSLYGLAALRTQLFGNPQQDIGYLALPILVTICAVAFTLNRTIANKDNVASLWAKTWIMLLVVWELWLWPETRSGPWREEPWMTDDEKVVLSVFLSLEAITLLAWIWIYKVYPFLVKYCHQKFALRCFWRIRPADTGEGYSYLPYGWTSLSRREFRYRGDKDENGRPHGFGEWQDNSYHGEVLNGTWQHGQPVVPFVSRCFGSGAISRGLKTGYGTKRLEGLSELHWTRERTETFLFGTCGVECSASGAFLAHLPQLFEYHQKTFPHAEQMVHDLQSTAGSETRDARDANSTARMSFLATPADSVLVFVHGYNCPIDWACMRLGQLMTLGNFGSSVLPLVFSWPTGRIPSFFQVRKQLVDFAPDLAEFLACLRRAGVKEMHLMAHSMGCELVTAALEHLERLNQEGGSQPLVKTISFCNASCPLSDFEQPMLSRIMGICERLTLYVDRDDFALWALELLARTKVLGCHTEPFPLVSPCPGGDVELPSWRPSQEDPEDPATSLAALRPRIDVVDCSSMDANVNGMRHGYFDLNTNLVADLKELIVDQKRAAQRSRLLRIYSDPNYNVFSFLAPPVFVTY
ncbi:unnamed protein product [Cladocopium goreaui]|uniref:AB hydrolase-1 domain-containing protein n=1 Tax=Cladocopium goreaui TaxID=2562237 RepID=A0A9P1GM90_9DINO|nr:unnamed protein product [Cladocopium goreaui]